MNKNGVNLTLSFPNPKTLYSPGYFFKFSFEPGPVIFNGHLKFVSKDSHQILKPSLTDAIINRRKSVIFESCVPFLMQIFS